MLGLAPASTPYSAPLSAYRKHIRDYKTCIAKFNVEYNRCKRGAPHLLTWLEEKLGITFMMGSSSPLPPSACDKCEHTVMLPVSAVRSAMWSLAIKGKQELYKHREDDNSKGVVVHFKCSHHKKDGKEESAHSSKYKGCTYTVSVLLPLSAKCGPMQDHELCTLSIRGKHDPRCDAETAIAECALPESVYEMVHALVAGPTTPMQVAAVATCHLKRQREAMADAVKRLDDGDITHDVFVKYMPTIIRHRARRGVTAPSDTCAASGGAAAASVSGSAGGDGGVPTPTTAPTVSDRVDDATDRFDEHDARAQGWYEGADLSDDEDDYTTGKRGCRASSTTWLMADLAVVYSCCRPCVSIRHVHTARKQHKYDMRGGERSDRAMMRYLREAQEAGWATMKVFGEEGGDSVEGLYAFIATPEQRAWVHKWPHLPDVVCIDDTACLTVFDVKLFCFMAKDPITRIGVPLAYGLYVPMQSCNEEKVKGFKTEFMAFMLSSFKETYGVLPRVLLYDKDTASVQATTNVVFAEYTTLAKKALDDVHKALLYVCNGAEVSDEQAETMMLSASRMVHRDASAYLTSACDAPPLTQAVGPLHVRLQRLVDTCIITSTEAMRLHVCAIEHSVAPEDMAQQLATYIIKYLRKHKYINEGYPRWSWLEHKVLHPLSNLSAVVDWSGPLGSVVRLAQTRVRLCIWHTLKAMREHCASSADTLMPLVQALRSAADVSAAITRFKRECQGYKKFVDYMDKQWFKDDDWRCTWFTKYRHQLPHLDVEVTNLVEAHWSYLKNCLFRDGMSFDGVDILRMLFGQPTNTTAHVGALSEPDHYLAWMTYRLEAECYHSTKPMTSDEVKRRDMVHALMVKAGAVQCLDTHAGEHAIMYKVCSSRVDCTHTYKVNVRTGTCDCDVVKGQRAVHSGVCIHVVAASITHMKARRCVYWTHREFNFIMGEELGSTMLSVPPSSTSSTPPPEARPQPTEAAVQTAKAAWLEAEARLLDQKKRRVDELIAAGQMESAMAAVTGMHASAVMDKIALTASVSRRPPQAAMARVTPTPGVTVGKGNRKKESHAQHVDHTALRRRSEGTEGKSKQKQAKKQGTAAGQQGAASPLPPVGAAPTSADADTASELPPPAKSARRSAHGGDCAVVHGRATPHTRPGMPSAGEMRVQAPPQAHKPQTFVTTSSRGRPCTYVGVQTDDDL